MTQSVAEHVTHAAYHRELFGALYDWSRFWKLALNMMGDTDSAVTLGLDQLGHFGPHGVRLVAQRLVAATDGPLARVVELGSGFGGTTRQIRRELAAKGLSPTLVALDIAPSHCELAAVIGRSIDDTAARFVVADVAAMPLMPGSADAIVVAGSASHFVAMQAVFDECARVLRPGGVLTMTEEVSLRTDGGPEPGPAFVQHHPFVHYASAGERRLQLERAGLMLESFEPLAEWATPLLKQRCTMMQLLTHCGEEMFGAEAYDKIVTTLMTTSEEYSRKSIEPALIVARRPR